MPRDPATVNDGEVAVASKAELHAAPLSGKRLLALWNALPGVEKRSKVGDRGALIDRLWPAIEALPDPELEPGPKRPSKRDEVIAMLRRPEGVWVEAVEKRICRGQHETDQEKVEEIECKRKETRGKSSTGFIVSDFCCSRSSSMGQNSTTCPKFLHLRP